MTSWSVSKNAPDNGKSDGSNPRSYISVLSEVIHSADKCDGAADDDSGESRMDSELLLLLLMPMLLLMLLLLLVSPTVASSFFV